MSVFSSPYSGYGNSSAFVGPGRPFLTSSNITGSLTNNGEIKIQFPWVTKNLTIVNTTAGQPIYIHFDSRTNPNIINNGHYVVLTNLSDAWAFDSKCREIFISMQNNTGTGSFSLSATLSGVDAKEAPTMTGSGINN